MNVFDKAIDTGVQRFIRIECPGIVEEEIEWQELPNGVKAGRFHNAFILMPNTPVIPR